MLVYYLLPVVVAWMVASLIKFGLHRYKYKKFSARPWYSTGDMPSVHTAAASAMAAGLAVYEGLNSPVFALSLVFAVVIAYDAMMARRATGEHGEVLRKLLSKSPFAKDPAPHHALGHKPVEVGAGLVIGVVVGFTVAYFITL